MADDACVGVDPLEKHLPPRHQAAEPADRPADARVESVRLRECQATDQWRTERVLDLQQVVACA